MLPSASYYLLYRDRREGVSFVKGNCFDIDVAAATACCRYDRIYIGAGCPESKKNFFFSLLADDGIMVAPIDDSNCLVRIRRQCRNVFTVTHMYVCITVTL
jgi:protein-L-isoaspartate O-methyltransferase